jgi:hypothetical protein
MSRDDQGLGEIEEVVRIAEALANAQEAEIGRLRARGVDVKHAEALLAAYREALRLAAERHRTLLKETARKAKASRNNSES